MSELRVLIVDDNEDVRSLLRQMIEVADEGLSVVGEAGNGGEGLRLWRETRPEVVLLDQQMPGLTGLDTAAIILRESPNQAVVIFTAYLDDRVQAVADEIGVRACVRKDDLRDLVLRLREWAAG